MKVVYQFHNLSMMEHFKITRLALLPLCLLFVLSACSQQKTDQHAADQTESRYEIEKTSDEWKVELSDQEFYVLREHGTERPFTGELLNNKEEGVYVCAACQYPLYESDTKFNSGTGWPSFFAPIAGNVGESKDATLGMVRTEVHCNRCGGHLGHVFNDGPEPTGMRHCINSVSLDFKKK